MEQTPDPDALVGARADERLLEEPPDRLPVSVGRPPAVPDSHARAAIVAIGATMTGVTLVGGLALIVLGLVAAFSDGADLLNGAAVGIGFALVATHWGWVHVAELAGTSASRRQARHALERRRQWLAEIAPHARHEVVTEVEDDGSIALLQVCYRPVPAGEGRFTFAREIEDRELHGDEEPAATITERAEQLRRDAALATERELERYLRAADRLERAQLLEADARELTAVRRAAAKALSERINTHLSRPPLDEPPAGDQR